MKKRIGMVGAVCLFVVCVCLGSRHDAYESEELINNTEVVFLQVSGTGQETENKTITEEKIGMEVDTESEMEVETEVDAETETQAEVVADKEADLIGTYAIADVDDYVNVRSEPSTDGTLVGKIYDDSVAEIVAVTDEAEDWFQIKSGNVEGYIKSEFFIYGEKAKEVLDEYVSTYAKIEADRLNVRADKSTESECIGHLNNGEKVALLEECGEWIKVQYTTQKSGYVSAEYVEIAEEYSYAKTLEEDFAERANKQENGQSIPAMSGVFPVTTYTSNEELRRNIINYALQFVGNRYINGGSSLAGGTDCSGFTCFIYKDFGYSISRTPGGQFSSAGRSIDYSEIQPGDIICYSSNGGKSCTHVALYMGDGQIVHAANSRKGVIIERADYDTIIGIRNVID